MASSDTPTLLPTAGAAPLAGPPAAAPPAPWQPRQGDEIAGRYELLRPLGRGGHGEVWTAHDRVLASNVAIKWLHNPGSLRSARARREIALLRTLRMPGVVRLIDEGIARGSPFVVMEILGGAPFPGPRKAESHDPAPWEEIAPAALSLLEVLSRVHGRGVVHRDLKPANVLVDAGRAVLLDFGVSHWDATDGREREGTIAGTPAYMAPEQLAGSAVDGRADLYAVGVMLFEALAGELPWGQASSLDAARAHVSARFIEERAPHAPGGLASTIARLLASDPRDRWRSAEEVLAALAPVSGRRAPRRRRAPFTERGLRSLFAGPDRIFHLREDAARHLFERAGTEPERVFAELDSWARLGIARATKEGYAVEPSGLSRLRYLRAMPGGKPGARPERPLEEGLSEAHALLSLAIRPLPVRVLAEALKLPVTEASARCEALVAAGAARRVEESFEAVGSRVIEESNRTLPTLHSALAAALDKAEEGRLYHLIAASRHAAAAAEAVALGRRLASLGDLAGARASLEEGLSAARLDPLGPDRLEEELLTELTKVAFAEGTPIAYDLTLYELARAAGRGLDAAALEALVRAAMRAPAAVPAEELSSLPSFKDAELQRRRNHLRVLHGSARADVTAVDQALAETRRWAEASNDRHARLCLAEGTAVRHYIEGDFEAAAAAHLAASELATSATDRLAAMVGAALSLIEAYRHREAEERGRQARKLAAQHRHFHSEARAEWIVRAARYRAGQALRPDLELCRAAERLGIPNVHAGICLQEATIALRSGDLETARDLSAIAHLLWSEMNRKWSALLVRSLGIRAGAAATAEEIARLAEEAAACPIVGIGLQALGLLARAEPHLGPRFANAIPALLAPIPAKHRGQRMDILSADEAVAELLGTAQLERGK